jgi:hypothetical protein
MPRRRGARAMAAEADAGRGLAMRMLLRSPKDVVAGALAFAAVSAIIANALFLQTGHHPAPMFGSITVMPPAGLAVANPLPRPRPAEADAMLSGSGAAETRAVEPRAVESKVVELKPAESRVVDAKPAEPRANDPLGNLLKATGAAPAAPSGVLRPPAPVPVATRAETAASSTSRRVAAVQRALTEYGYGQLKPTGTVGSDTQAAIQRFERERKLPVTGQMSDRLVRELAAVIGHPVD